MVTIFELKNYMRKDGSVYFEVFTSLAAEGDRAEWPKLTLGST